MKQTNYKIIYPIEWNERECFEVPSRGWIENIIVTVSNGDEYQLCFYDPIRLHQDLIEEVKSGNNGIIEKGLIIIPEITKENIEKAIRQAFSEGYFE